MTIEARAQDIESGNILFTRHFRNLDDAEAFAREQEDDDTRIRFVLRQHS